MKSELRFPSKIENINLVERLIDEISASCNLSSEIYGNLLVAMVEAVNNAIIHGNKLDESKEVHIWYEIDSHNIIFEVKDQGPGFNFNHLPDPTLPENLEKPHGRGIFLMKHLVDEMQFSDNGARVKLKFCYA
jgi:serine/threonine-protein kinase RsbW